MTENHTRNRIRHRIHLRRRWMRTRKQVGASPAALLSLISMMPTATYTLNEDTPAQTPDVYADNIEITASSDSNFAVARPISRVARYERIITGYMGNTQND